MKNALIQASLDPAVRTIEFVPSSRVHDQTVQLNAVVLTRDDGRYAIDIPELRVLHDIDSEGLILLALHELGIGSLELSEREIRREPRHSNCREVWSHRSATVPINARVYILTALEEGGVLSINDLNDQISAEFPPASAIFALACEGAIEIDLSERPLSGNTTVRRVTAALDPTGVPGFGRS